MITGAGLRSTACACAAKRSRIKHNRITAPGISFDQPNLPVLIEEIERDLLNV